MFATYFILFILPLAIIGLSVWIFVITSPDRRKNR